MDEWTTLDVWVYILVNKTLFVTDASSSTLSVSSIREFEKMKDDTLRNVRKRNNTEKEKKENRKYIKTSPWSLDGLRHICYFFVIYF